MKRTTACILFIILILNNLPGQAQAKAALNPYMVAGDGTLSAVIMPDGTLLEWGDNEFGQVGNYEHGDYDYKTIDKVVLKPNASLNDVKAVTVISNSVYALRKDDSLWSWGFNCNGKLGNGNNGNQAVPNKIMEDVKFVASGHGLHGMAIKKDDSLWAWGWNEHYQLGDGTNKNRYKPVKVMENVKYAAVGYGYSAVIKEDDSLWTWGDNAYGCLGNGNKTDQKKPVKILEKVKAVSLGQLGGCALKTDGTLWAWGYNINGDVGDGTTTRRSKPVKIMSGVAAISTKMMGFFMALKEDGTLWSWGSNDCGQLGSGTTKARYTPEKVMSDVVSFDNGTNTSYAIKKDNTLWVWGCNEIGQLGTGDKKNRQKPEKIMDLDTFSETGSYTKPARYIDGSLSDWGDAKPIISDETGDVDKDQIDLKDIYAYKDKTYLYLAASYGGKMTDISFFLDYNDDGNGDYHIAYDSKNYSTYILSESKDGYQEYNVTSVNDVLELRVPLSALGKPKHMCIKCSVYTEDYDLIDETDGWVELY